ncbi:serine hydrolase domain-containing protein [Buchananella felis]|uniref:serine hydrolase domain-containing protein n=1 Tax=Buchananella felis TaxID=3231492 RepID=UPI003528C706
MANVQPLADFPFPTAVILSVDGREVYRAGEVETTFRWASVSKLLTALGVHLAVDRHLLSLEDSTGVEGATVAHLLAHTGGVDLDSSQQLAAPGTRRIYSNFGHEELGRVLAQATGMEAADWLEQEVLIPLGMPATEVGNTAHGATGPATDLILLARELLTPTLLTAPAHAAMTSPAWPGLPGVLPGYGRQADNLWGMGPEIRAVKSPHWLSDAHTARAYGHFGQAGSFLWCEPELSACAVFLGAQPFGQTHRELWPRLNAELLRIAAT